MSLESLAINELNLDRVNVSDDAPTSSINRFSSATSGNNSANSGTSSPSKKEEKKEDDDWTPRNAPVDWKEQMKQIIARNLHNRDAYADKHEVQAATARRQSKLFRPEAIPEEPKASRADRRQLVRTGRVDRAGNAHSMGQFYCAKRKVARERTVLRRRQAPRRVSLDRSIEARDQRAQRAFPGAISPPRRQQKPRFRCVLLDDFDKARTARRVKMQRQANWGETLSAQCIDSVLATPSI